LQFLDLVVQLIQVDSHVIDHVPGDLNIQLVPFRQPPDHIARFQRIDRNHRKQLCQTFNRLGNARNQDNPERRNRQILQDGQVLDASL
jgi:hypothetical protein